MQTSCTRSLVSQSQTLSSIVQAPGRGTCTILEGKSLAPYRTHSSKFNLKHSQWPCRASQLWLEWGHTQNAGNTSLCSPDWLGELLSSVREDNTVHCTLQCTIQGWCEGECGDVWDSVRYRRWCNEGVGCPTSSPLNHSPVLSLHTTCFQ